MRRRTFLALPAVTVALWSMCAHAQTDPKPYMPEQLDQMLAPVALYPDPLLSQVMMAATYPLEVVEAARWSKANPNLKGDAAVAAVKDLSWDVSVKPLVAFPSVLEQMNDHLDWTWKTGRRDDRAAAGRGRFGLRCLAAAPRSSPTVSWSRMSSRKVLRRRTRS